MTRASYATDRVHEGVGECLYSELERTEIVALGHFGHLFPIEHSISIKVAYAS